MVSRTLAISIFCLLSGLLQATPLYINDTLRVGVRTEPNRNLKPIGVITTGTVIHVLARADGYIKIRTDEELVGWIKDSYVTDTPPAKLQLVALQEENVRLQARVEQQAAVMNETDSVSNAMVNELDLLRGTVAELRLELLKTQSGYSNNTALKVSLIIGLLLILGAAAFAGGIVYHRNQAMRRLGGLRLS